MTRRTWSRTEGGRAGEVGRPDVDASFVELVSTDAELLRLEFDAIIAANFPHPVGRSRHRPPGWRQPPTRNRRRRIVPPDRGRPSRSGHRPAGVRSAVDGRARQRSPPHALRPPC
jgi:hypothetical protein